MEFKTPQQAWEGLQSYCSDVYDSLSAMYSGEHSALTATGLTGSFWKRSTTAKGKMHVPIVADIAATSANLLFGQEPTFTSKHQEGQADETQQQERLDYIIGRNNFEAKLLEAAESCSVMGDVYFKIRWNVNSMDYPFVDVVQGDSAYPEYMFGDMVCLHSFTELSRDKDTGKFIRMYERYSKGEIHLEMYEGTESQLGSKMPDERIIELGYQPDVKCPIDEILAVHVANIRPNRKYRSSMLGRSDFDGLRDLCDALDEAYSSWIRDIRLAKAKLIVPVDYLRRKPQEMLDGVAQNGSWEFDPDIETYVAMDIQTNDGGTGNYITPSQFDIRSQQHADTCMNLIQNILQMAGYSPQTFGMEINGSSSSGTALNIRERKSASTRDKKQVYWIAPIEQLLTMLVRVDHALYPSAGSDGEDEIEMRFADNMGYDITTLASAVQALNAAQAASTETKVRLIHEDWTEERVLNECDKIAKEYAVNINGALDEFGNPIQNIEEPIE